MADLNFTAEQRSAIFTRGTDLLVSAGAGSGKTSVLVQRIIERVKQGGEVDRILALTFTKAAAADMRSKIDAALTAAAAAAPDDLHLARQAALVGQAHISTIHSYCLELLRAQHYRVGLSPSFRVAGESEMKSLLAQVLDEVFEEGYAAGDGRLIALADAFGGSRDDSSLAQLVQQLHEYSLSRPHPREWLRRAADDGVDELDRHPFALYLDQALAFDLQALARRLQLAGELPDLPQAYLALCREETAALRAAAAVSGLSRRLEALAGLSLSRPIPRLKKGALGDVDQNGAYLNHYDRDNCERFKERRAAVRDSLKSLQKKYCSRSLNQIEADLEAVRPLLKDLAELVIVFGERADREKRRRGWVDFADLEQLTLELLDNDDLASELRQSFDEVLVDEYQDINQVQEAIVSRLAAPGCLFSVGDVKQSIYRFRSADPGLFLDKYLLFARGEQGRRIDLNRNFRSCRRVVDGVNHLFRRLMLAPAMELDYDEAAELKAASEAEGFPPELHLLDLDLSGGDAPVALLAEGRLIARRILEIKADDPELDYSQIAVLLRTSKGREEVIAAALAEAGIPALATAGSSFADSPEVALTLSLLQLIDNPEQDLPLAAVLRSPLYGFSSDQLVEIRLLDKKAGLWQALQLAAASELPFSDEVRRFLDQLSEWRRQAGEKGVDELLLTVYHDTALPGLVGAMEGGERRQANLSRLYTKAHQYQALHASGLFRFLLMLDDERRLTADREAAPWPGAGADAVQIMSIHKSKGLEFPVVFVAGLAGQFNTQDERADVIYQSDLGLAARRVLRERHLKFNTLAHLAVARRQHEQSLAEEMRVLYVALTRAKRRLILTASARRLSRMAAAWPEQLDDSGKLQQFALGAAAAPLDWLLPALLSDGGAGCLRELCEGKLPPAGEGAAWRCFIHPLSELALPPAPTVSEADLSCDEALLRQAGALLEWTYPHADRCLYPAKWSVSELNRLFLQDEEERSAVRLLPGAEEEEEAFSRPGAKVRGSAIHRLLELMDLAAVSRDGIRAQMDGLCRSGQLTAEEAEAVDAAVLERFFQSQLGRRLQRAESVRRESPFTMRLDLDADDDLLVQGVIDAAFREDGGWVLLDYKTGGRGKSDGELIAEYGEQLAYYRLAIERLWDAPVREAWLCMLDLGRNIRL